MAGSTPNLQVVNKDGEYATEDFQKFAASTRLERAGMDYQIVAIMGPQSSGKSPLLLITSRCCPVLHPGASLVVSVTKYCCRFAGHSVCRCEAYGFAKCVTPGNAAGLPKPVLFAKPVGAYAGSDKRPCHAQASRRSSTACLEPISWRWTPSAGGSRRLAASGWRGPPRSSPRCLHCSGFRTACRDKSTFLSCCLSLVSRCAGVAAKSGAVLPGGRWL